MANSVVLARIFNPRYLKSLKPSFSHSIHCSLARRRNPYVFKDLTFVRFTKNPTGCNINTNWRYLSDKFSEKGRGDEKNYFLKIGREQFIKLKERQIKEIKSDIQALEVEVRQMDGETSPRAEKVRQNLMMEIRELKNMLEKFKKSL